MLTHLCTSNHPTFYCLHPSPRTSPPSLPPHHSAQDRSDALHVVFVFDPALCFGRAHAPSAAITATKMNNEGHAADADSSIGPFTVELRELTVLNSTSMLPLAPRPIHADPSQSRTSGRAAPSSNWITTWFAARAALAPDVHKTPSAVPPHKTKKDECRSIQVYALTSVVDEDDQDCGGDAKTIKDHGGDDDDDDEDNQDNHGGDDEDAKTITAAATMAKTITAAATMAKTIKTVATRRRSGTTAAAVTTTRRQSRRRRRCEGDHGDNDNDAKAITAAVTTATTIKTAAATQGQPQQRRRKDDAKTITVARAKTITTAAAGRAM
ncbi:hypothetical protein EDB84DRAFT_1565343 [Lactarius hengduanensis]|nr:hypothetical protein EDB84DRAFT_1565343 [Lactarius hengduanensis]